MSPNKKIYKSFFKASLLGENSWEKVEVKYTINEILHKNELTVFIYNPTQQTSFFDDMKIVHKKYNR